MIVKAIHNALERVRSKGWEKSYWAFDIHETIIEPNWSNTEVPKKFYPLAIETLQLLSKRKDIVMMLYTCSHPSEIKQYLRMFEANDVHFDYVNENPEVENGGFGCYDKKPYFNVLFEDKAGFDALSDWQKVFDLVKSWEGAEQG